jgi:SAM-dependent methyltransferase
MSDAKQLVQRRFGTHAAGYVSSPTHARGYSLERLAGFVDPQPGQRLLDVATGGGHTALRLAQSGAWTIAADLTRPMLHVARDHITTHAPPGPVVYAQLDAERLPFAPDSFDAATCRIAPHHFPDVAGFVREMARVVRPGGRVVVVDQLTPPDPKTARYVNAFERLRDPSHIWAYSQGEWEGFFSGAGLAVEHFERFEVEQNLLRWAEIQGCDSPTITRLRALLAQAPDPAAAWMQPHLDPTGGGTFVIRQFLMVGRKAHES